MSYKVFLHSYLAFNANSTLFYGDRDAILIDAPQLFSDCHRMVAEIIPMRRNLTHIYISHFHPDHHFSLSVLAHQFPEAKIVALPSVVKDIVFTSVDKVDMWSIDRFGNDIPSKTTIPMPLHEPRLELEGHELLFFDDWEGDSVNNSVVWVPSLKVACATDVAFHQCNVWTLESDVQRRVKWRADIKRLMDFDPRIVIPGHHDEPQLRILEEVHDDPSRTYTDCVDWSLKYLDVYEEAYTTAKNGTELVEGVNKYYGDVRPADFNIQWQTRLIFPRSAPEWLLPLPGPPGKIFLNPNGVFDGDPPKE
ncbi:MAG: MBL fold metallo-hydrolase [Actinobacteria bacterium]|nr:MBL fold metallo-hydrolase [Actinomycetota bacterium]